MAENRPTHIRLTSHPEPGGGVTRWPIAWGAGEPRARGPVVGSVTNPGDRNVIGAHGGSYSLYRALAVSSAPQSAGSGRTSPTPIRWCRSARIRNGSSQAASSRSIPSATWPGRCSDGDRRGARHPAHHRHHQGAAEPAGSGGRAVGRAPDTGRRHPARDRRRLASPRSRSTRSGICRASPSASAPPRPCCAARCSSRPAACIPSW
jgi:hypothetical protein